jgi:hypothetical protein
MLTSLLAAGLLVAGPVTSPDGLRVVDETRARVLDLRLYAEGTAPVRRSSEARSARRTSCPVAPWIALVASEVVASALGGHYYPPASFPLDYLGWRPDITEREAPLH